MRQHHLIGFSAALILTTALGLYMAFEPTRQTQAQQDLLTHQVSEGQVLYAEDCAICHGASGEGLGANPPLDSDGLRDMDYDTLYKVIARGRYNTAMPAWSVTDDGPLNDAQIEALIAQIQHGDWLETRAVVVDLGLEPRAPISVTVPIEALSAIAALPGGAQLAAGVETYAAECVACHGADGQGTPLAVALNTEAIRADRGADQLTSAITNGVAGTVMPAWSGTLPSDQIRDLVALIQRWDEIPAGAIPEPPDEPIIVTEELLATGEALYASSCARCHGTDGQGTRRAPALNVQSFFAVYSVDAAVEQVISLGVPGTAMPAWGDRLGEGEIEAIVAYLRAWEPTAPAVAVTQTGGFGGPPWQRNNAAPNPQPLAPDPTPWAAPTASQTTEAAAGIPASVSGSPSGDAIAGDHGEAAPADDATVSRVDWRIVGLIGVPGAFALSTLVGAVLALWRLRGK